MVVIIALILPFHLSDNFKLLGFLVPLILLFIYSICWRKTNYDSLVTDAKSRGTYEINHEKRINSWCAYFFTVGIVNILILTGLGLFMKDLNAGIVASIPNFIFIGITYLLLRYKTKQVSIIFSIYYVLMLLFEMNIILFIIGLIGAIECYLSVKELNSTK